MENRIRITLTRSLIGERRDQRQTARSLGLTRIRKAVVHDDTPQVRGMVRKIRHLVAVEALGPGAGDPAEG